MSMKIMKQKFMEKPITTQLEEQVEYKQSIIEKLEDETCQLSNQVFDLENEKNWPTPTSIERSGINPKTGKGEGLSKQAKNWATPNTMDYMPCRSYEAMKRQATSGGRKNRERPGNLREQIDPLMCQAYQEAKAENNQENLPPPDATNAVVLLCTKLI